MSSKVQLRLRIAWFWRLHLRLTSSQGPRPKLSGDTARQFKDVQSVDVVASNQRRNWLALSGMLSVGKQFLFLALKEKPVVHKRRKELSIQIQKY